jgi:hypothetical protein
VGWGTVRRFILETEGFEDDLYHEEFGSARRNGF